MKKILTVILLTVTICGLVACGNTEESQTIDEVKVETVEDSEEETEPPSIEEVTKQEETESNLDGNYFGTWEVVKYYMPGVSALSKEEADGYIGKVCVYSEDSFTGDGAVTNAPDYQECEMTANDFSTYYGGITFDSVGITADSVKQVNVSNAYDFGSSFYVTGTNTILISSDGVFFEAVRQ